MAFDISGYLQQNVSLSVKNGTDKYGKPTYGSPTLIKVRFQSGMKLIKDKTGKEAVSQGTIWTKLKIGLDDKITYESKDYSVLNYSDKVDFDGNFIYREVMV